MRILVLATNYPTPDGQVSSRFIHTRNLIYKNEGIDVFVLSFRAKTNYKIDGINVYTLKTFEETLKHKNFDILLSHAANLRNHYKFLKKYDKFFNEILFYFHGHEVLITSQIYPKPYNYIKKDSVIIKLIKEIYDRFKLKIWQRYFIKNYTKCQFLFVSRWMYSMFVKFNKIKPCYIQDRTHIIYNCIGDDFEYNTYNKASEKIYDFITIRNDIDGSKYCIDVVCNIAENNSKYKFCLIGKGKFFQFNKKPDNLVWIDKNLDHYEIIEFLNKSKCALLPTRTDAQGVMACEIATFGIPLITSNIDVCKEVFEGFDNLGFIDNNELNIDITSIFDNLVNKKYISKNESYFKKNTVGQEIELFRKLMG